MAEHSLLQSSLFNAAVKTKEAASANELASADININFSPVPVQRKLSVGAVDDPLEDDADAMADKVMRMSEPNFIQRKCAHCEEEENLQRKPLVPFLQKKSASYNQPENGKYAQQKSLPSFLQKKEAVGNNNDVTSEGVFNRIQATQGSGEALPVSAKTFLESRFGADFSNVHIHTDSNAVQLSKQLNAKAFTVGNDIYFDRGKYQPETTEGKHLLAHELTHVMQQNAGIYRKPAEPVDFESDNMYTRFAALNTRAGGYFNDFQLVQIYYILDDDLGLHDESLSEYDIIDDAFWAAYPEMNKKKITKQNVPDARLRAEYIRGYMFIKNYLYPFVATDGKVLFKAPAPKPKPEKQPGVYIAEIKAKGADEQHRIFKELKEKLKKPDNYQGRAYDQAVFNGIDGPLLSYLEDEKDSTGNQYVRRTPEGWVINGGGFTKAYEGATTWEAIRRYKEGEAEKVEHDRLKKIEQEGGDIAMEIYWSWRNKWDAKYKKALQQEKWLREGMQSKFGEDVFRDKWMHFQNGLIDKDETWLNALGPEYRRVYAEIQQAEYRLIADPTDVLGYTRASVGMGKWPTDEDFEKFVKYAYENRKYREIFGAIIVGVYGSFMSGEALPPEGPIPPEVPVEPVPVEPVPAEPLPAEPVPAEPVPAEPSPSEPAPAEPSAAEPVVSKPATPYVNNNPGATAGEAQIGEMLNGKAQGGQLKGVTSVEGAPPKPTQGRSGDYRFNHPDGTQTSADLYQPESGNPDSIGSNIISGKSGQADTVVVELGAGKSGSITPTAAQKMAQDVVGTPGHGVNRVIVIKNGEIIFDIGK